jgi:hypothetical protein
MSSVSIEALKASVKTCPRWVKITKQYSDFSAAALIKDTEIYSLPAASVIHAVQTFLFSPFSGGLIASYTISVGTSGNFVKYQPATSVFTGASSPQPTAVMGVESFSSSTSIRAKAISTVGNLNTATQGTIIFYLLVSTLE